MSENKYRDYLQDDTFHRRYLKNEDEPIGSSFLTKLLVGTGAVVGIAAGSAAAYKRGLLKKPMEQLIERLGGFRRTRLQDRMQGLRNWSDDEIWEDMKDLKFTDRLQQTLLHATRMKDYVDKGLDVHMERMARLRNSPFSDNMPSLVKMVQDQGAAIREMERRFKGTDRFVRLNAARQLMNRRIDNLNNITNDQELAMATRTGYRQARVEDTYSFLTDEQKAIIDDLNQRFNDGQLQYNPMQKILDQDILIKEGARPGAIGLDDFADLRDSKNLMADMMNSVAEDFTIPFIKINPIRMFYLNEFTRVNNKPIFTVLRSENRQPWLTHNNQPAGTDFLYDNGRVLDLNQFDETTMTFKEVASNGYLLNATGENSPITRLTRNMMNVTISEYTAPTSGLRKLWYNWVAKPLDIGLQDEPIKHSMEVGDPASPVTALADWMHRKFLHPYEGVTQIKLEKAFGADADWLFMQSYKNLDEAKNLTEFFGQFWASRNNPKDVTTASMFAYGFAERLNATLNQVGMGLSTKNLGSAPQILGNLVARRLAPLWVGVEGIKYSNYLFEQFAGDEYEDIFANMFAEATLGASAMRDALGITEWSKETANLMPGIEFLSELPIPFPTTEGMTPIMMRDLIRVLPFAPSTMTEEELEQYYKTGEEEVRKGRYWEFGNTPLTGGKIDYFQPNWFRRVTSDWEYTDTLWGSKDEYWANHALPTLTHPFAPLNHFLLDPYHWERKHYEDRPYMQTGGIPEIENFPLIGSVLNATVGQLLKPTMQMHTDEWQGKGTYKEGHQLAAEYGLFGGGEETTNIFGVGFGGFYEAVSNGLSSYNTGGNYSGEVNPSEPVAYVTSSGNVRVMAKDAGVNIRDLNYSLREQGIAKAGGASNISVSGDLQPFYSRGEEALNPASLHGVMSDLHYNFTEMGGFYGWISTMPTNMKANEYDPKIQTSIKAYGYERAFWDMDLGNMGGDANEIFRRFLTRDSHKNYINPIDNNMPTWLPGQDYFTNFQTGDPYVKVKKGEMRLPGHSYEVLYGIDSEKLDRMEVGASTIGYDKQKIVDKILQRDAIEDEQKRFVTERGDAWHKAWEADMAAQGVAVAKSDGGYMMEQYVKDEATSIGGFYDVYAHHDKALEWLIANAAEFTYYNPIDTSKDLATAEEVTGYYESTKIDLSNQQQVEAFKQFALAASPYTLIDPKTRTSERWEEQEMQWENVQQVNFYAQQMQTPINYLIHVDANNPDRGIKVFAFGASDDLYNYSVNKVESARNDVRTMMRDGVIGRGDMYDMVDRYRILADVAPYSQEFRQMKSQLSKMNLDEKDMDEIRIINEQVSARKEQKRTYDYRFTTANVETQAVTVTKVIDNNMFMTAEHPDNPIKLAGVYVPTGQDDPVAEHASDVIGQAIQVGQKVRITVDADEMNRINPDTYRTISAVVRGGSIENLNRELIQRGLAKEKEDDYSPAAVHARFTEGQILFGKAWEKFVHIDTPFHTKLMQVRSPLEQYERREVYGKDWQDWGDPVGDYAVPWYQNWISKSPMGAIALGAMMGSFFGHKPFGKVLGAAIGALSSAVGVSYVQAVEMASGDKWIPDRREKEREIEEYVDTLKFVKFRGLYEEFADQALRKEGFNVRNYIAKQEGLGDYRKDRVRALQAVKRTITTAARPAEVAEARREAVRILGGAAYGDNEELLEAINAEIRKLQNARHVDKITPIAAQALMYYNESEKTMYGYDPGEPIQNVLSALPRKERMYLTKFLQAPEEERDDILGTVPGYVRRILQSAWGMDVDEKPTLEEYFRHHELPDADWAGWDPRANLDDIKIKMVKREGLDLSEFNAWPDDEKRANQIRDDIVPQVDYSTKASIVKQRLRDILGGAGLQNLDVVVTPTASPGIDVDIDVQKDRRAEIIQALNSDGYSLLG